MIKLKAQEGSTYYNKSTDTYHKLVYLPDSADISIYEEVRLVTEESKTNKILQSKLNLSTYLENNPLFSRCKYADGRYYNVTMEKQNLLLANISTYTMSIQMGIDCPLTWNDTGKECEVWTIDELLQLSLEIRNYVLPLTSLQQYMEAHINDCVTEEQLENINIEFTEETINEYLPIFQKKFDNNEK